MNTLPVTTFAAIDVGSNNITMKIYELTKKNGLHELEAIKHTLELGYDTYTHGSISYPVIQELIQTLEKFSSKLKEYDVSDYTACATSGLREAKNGAVSIDLIRLRTGLDINVLSNSEQRFLCYKALSFFESPFHKMIQKNTAVVDVSSGSIQISLFQHNVLQSTQNIKLGSLRIREILSDSMKETLNYTNLLHEYIDYDLTTYETLFLPNTKIRHMICFGEQLNELIRLAKKLSFGETIEAERYTNAYQSLMKKGIDACSKELNLSKEQTSLLLPTAIIFEKLLTKTKAGDIYFSNTSLCDGLAVDYAMKKGKLLIPHNFEGDIIEISRNIARRYHCDESHITNVESIALTIFDSMKKLHGLEKRERLYLQIAVILHSCGEFINMNHVEANSYHIIMSTEIIGLSHKERLLVANLVRYKASTFPNLSSFDPAISPASYLMIAKLTAILRLANALDKSHKQKLKTISCHLKCNEQGTQLLIETESFENITLEKGLFSKKADFFEEVFGVRPILKQKRSL